MMMMMIITGNIYIYNTSIIHMRSAALGSFQTLWFWSFFYCAFNNRGTLFLSGRKRQRAETFGDQNVLGFRETQRDPSSSIFVILSVTTSSSKKIVDPGNGETNKFLAFWVSEPRD